MKDIGIQTNCPECGSNWIYDEIPKESRQHYKPPYFFSRLIGIETPEYDGVSYFKCHSLDIIWDRFTGERVNEE